MWRQGDILIAAIDQLPAHASRSDTRVLARGEMSGHSHRLAMPGTAELWSSDSSLFLRVITNVAAVIHEEHHSIMVPRGTYRVWGQREYIAANRAPGPVLPEPADDDVLLIMAGAQVIDSDHDIGGERQLLRIATAGLEDIVCLSVTCPSSGKRYRIRVPPRMSTCHAAAAWIAGFDNPDEYHPLIET